MNNTPELAYGTVALAVSVKNVQISVATVNNMLAVEAGERLKCLA